MRASIRSLAAVVVVSLSATGCGVIPLPASGAAMAACNEVIRDISAGGVTPLTLAAAFDADVAAFRRVKPQADVAAFFPPAAGSFAGLAPDVRGALCYIDLDLTQDFPDDPDVVIPEELAVNSRMVIGYVVDPVTQAASWEGLNFGPVDQIPVVMP